MEYSLDLPRGLGWEKCPRGDSSLSCSGHTTSITSSGGPSLPISPTRHLCPRSRRPSLPPSRQVRTGPPHRTSVPSHTHPTYVSTPHTHTHSVTHTYSHSLTHTHTRTLTHTRMSQVPTSPTFHPVGPPLSAEREPSTCVPRCPYAQYVP